MLCYAILCYFVLSMSPFFCNVCSHNNMTITIGEVTGKPATDEVAIHLQMSWIGMCNLCPYFKM